MKTFWSLSPNNMWMTACMVSLFLSIAFFITGFSAPRNYTFVFWIPAGAYMCFSFFAARRAAKLSRVNHEASKSTLLSVVDIHVSKDGKQYGPLTIGQLQEHVRQGNFTTADHACCDGHNWVKIGQVPGLIGRSQQPPPASGQPPSQSQKPKVKQAPKRAVARPRRHMGSLGRVKRKISGMNRGHAIIVAKSGSVVPSVIGSMVGAIIGAGAWAGIAIATEHEIGYAAVLVGVLAGYGAKILSQGDIVALGMAAALCSILGVLAGKYIFTSYSISNLPDVTYEYYLQEMSTGSLAPEEMVSRDDFYEEIDQSFVELYGAKASDVTLASFGPIIRFSVEPENEVFTLYDLLWGAIAVGAAWRINSH